MLCCRYCAWKNVLCKVLLLIWEPMNVIGFYFLCQSETIHVARWIAWSMIWSKQSRLWNRIGSRNWASLRVKPICRLLLVRSEIVPCFSHIIFIVFIGWIYGERGVNYFTHPGYLPNENDPVSVYAEVENWKESIYLPQTPVNENCPHSD